jgi:signal transduction histidine kinase/CheY-like chemotaxis protein/purine-cytosine permease-like protein
VHPAFIPTTWHRLAHDIGAAKVAHARMASRRNTSNDVQTTALALRNTRGHREFIHGSELAIATTRAILFMTSVAIPTGETRIMHVAAAQRIDKVRRDYNTWVANETLEDYALRFTPRAFRKWTEFRIANTALGSISFLALEAIGGAITLSYGFSNALWAIVVVSVVIFLTGLPISYYSAKYGVDMDLLTRGAGFGYIGSTITSLIYASFTFIFFALEASIMAQAMELYFKLPLVLGYVVCSLVVIPLVTHGITFISRLQSWTQPLWVVLLILPYACILYKEPDAIGNLLTFSGKSSDGGGFNFLLFGSAATVAFSLIAQIGEQVDFLRFLPEKTRANRVRWWSALIFAGPGWILVGAAKMLGGALLAFLAIQNEVPIDKAMEPTQMYLIGFRYVFTNPAWILGAATLFVVVSQVKINVTNAYAGSLAWSNFFARLTHSHPGRVVWLVFNVLISLLLMQVGVFKALEHVLAIYSLVAISWIGAVVADLVISKPLGLSPPQIEFKRAHLYDINPVGVGAMLIASVVSAGAMSGQFGTIAQSLAPFIALGTALLSAPAIAALTRGRFYIARADLLPRTGKNVLQCVICENRFEAEDMAHCPAYQGSICSLCCSLDARCNDRCKTDARLSDQISKSLQRILPLSLGVKFHTRIAHYLIVLALLSGAVAGLLGLLYYQELVRYSSVAHGLPNSVKNIFFKLFSVMLLVTGIGSWWIVLTNESRRVAQEESDRQTNLLLREIAAHNETDVALQRAKEVAEAANLAKSRYVTGMSHELRTPLNSILGYAQILQMDSAIPPARRDAINVIRRSGEHLLGLIDGLLDIARIEAGKMRLESDELSLPEFLEQIVNMFTQQAASKNLAFHFNAMGRMPGTVHTDQKRLRQILINLLGNAIKFTDSGSITMRVQYAREIALFNIEDTGIGIADEDIDRIFLPFERGNAARQRDDIGTGLGLAISSMLAHIMGGELSVKSRIGSGSVFTLKVYLPEVHSPRPVIHLNESMPGYVGSRKRILVVDDQPSQRTLLSDMLAPRGFDLADAETGSACLDEIARCMPDLVLLDIAMPGMDGWAVCRAIRDRGWTDLPIIVVSANAFDTILKRGENLCNNDFVVKPVSLIELLSKIKLHLGISWINTPSTSAPAQPARQMRLVPSADKLKMLLQLSTIGYVKGIHEKLDEIDSQDRLYAPYTDELRRLAKQFQLHQFSALILKDLHHDVDNAG